MNRLWMLGVLAASCGSSEPEPAPFRREDIPEEVVVLGQKIPLRKGDVMYAQSPDRVVHDLLALADVKPTDVVYDLGCGDGRYVIAAAREFGARGVGIEIDPVLVREATENARKAGVADKVEFRQGDIFEVDISQATVVVLYLLEKLNVRLRPKLQRELRPGSRVASHMFGMGDWKPDREAKVGTRPIYVWTIGDAPHPE